jgi:hypothetical protein
MDHTLDGLDRNNIVRKELFLFVAWRVSPLLLLWFPNSSTHNGNRKSRSVGAMSLTHKSIPSGLSHWTRNGNMTSADCSSANAWAVICGGRFSREDAIVPSAVLGKNKDRAAVLFLHDDDCPCRCCCCWWWWLLMKHLCVKSVWDVVVLVDNRKLSTTIPQRWLLAVVVNNVTNKGIKQERLCRFRRLLMLWRW